MFYCKYCNKHKDESQIHTEYKKSIKCLTCARNTLGVDINKLHPCACGGSYTIKSFHRHITTLNHKKLITENP